MFVCVKNNNSPIPAYFGRSADWGLLRFPLLALGLSATALMKKWLTPAVSDLVLLLLSFVVVFPSFFLDFLPQSEYQEIKNSTPS